MKKMVKRSMTKVADEDFSSVFEIISCRRNRALMAVNVELLMTYWEIGAFLSPRIHAGSWDASFVGRLADYLKRQDPTLRGYGKSNLYNMAKVYDVFSSEEFSALNDRYQKQLTAGLDFSSCQLEKVSRGARGGVTALRPQRSLREEEVSRGDRRARGGVMALRSQRSLREGISLTRRPQSTRRMGEGGDCGAG